MRLTTRGSAGRVAAPVVGRISTQTTDDRTSSILLATAPLATYDLRGYRATLTAQRLESHTLTTPIVHSLRETDHFRDGDVVVVQSDGFVRTLYRPDSLHNTLFVTERCNSNCLMCSQPPKDRDDIEHFLAINTELINLMQPAPATIGITGGEPTLLRDHLCTLLTLLRTGLPTTQVHLLTNGRLFAWPAFTEQFARISHPHLVVAVPLYSDAASDHDYIVQARNAFDQTVLGLHALARWRIPIELRIVLHKPTVARLVPLAEFIYRNLPFVAHVALMGLEPTGYTPYNRAKLWVDPTEYQQELTATVEYLSIRGLSVSIYNLPHCLLPQSLWKFARQSISDWKNIFLPECQHCAQRHTCAGLFQSAETFHSPHIHPL